MPPIITLLTDFGTADGYVAEIKGTILSTLPGATRVAILSYFIYALMHVAVRRTIAGDKKNQTSRAALDVADRLRRDLRWAVDVKLEPSGDSMVLLGADGSMRPWAFDRSRHELEALASLGISMDQVTGELESEGVAAFAKSFQDLMESIAAKRAALSARSIPFPAALGNYQAAVEQALDRLANENILGRIWKQDHTVWKPDPKENLGLYLTLAVELVVGDRDMNSHPG